MKLLTGVGILLILCASTLSCGSYDHADKEIAVKHENVWHGNTAYWFIASDRSACYVSMRVYLSKEVGDLHSCRPMNGRGWER